MRYAVIMAGGSGTRLWPMSRASLPKQLIPFIHGKSLLEVAYDRLDGLVSRGIFVWRASTVLSCIERYEPANAEGLRAIADAWDTPARDAVLGTAFPSLKKVSIDIAVMERAAADPHFKVVAVPMALSWLDVGSWPTFAETCCEDAQGSRLGTDRTARSRSKTYTSPWVSGLERNCSNRTGIIGARAGTEHRSVAAVCDRR